MYTPSRDDRFHYASDLINFIEENQCVACRFRKTAKDWGADHADDYPMCSDIEGEIILEQPVIELEDRGAAGVVCTKFMLGDTPEPVDPGQLPLFDN